MSVYKDQNQSILVFYQWRAAMPFLCLVCRKLKEEEEINTDWVYTLAYFRQTKSPKMSDVLVINIWAFTFFFSNSLFGKYLR